MDICSASQCSNMNCVLRHPIQCKYFSNYGRCKFEERCAYLHSYQTAVDDNKIKELEKEIDIVKSKISETEILLFKLESFENRIKSLEEKNAESISEIKNILEKNGIKLQDLDQNFYILVHSVDDLEKSSKYLKHQFQILSDQSQNVNCNLCGQGFSNEQTLRNHIQKNHATFKT